MNKQKQYQKEQRKLRWIYTFYGSKWFSFPLTFKRRIKAYQKAFNIGKNPIIEHNVIFSRTHGLEGYVEVGNKVTLARNVYIDYSGSVIIKDNVKIAADVIIESHHRDLDAFKLGKDVNIPTKLLIEENAYIGLRAIILDSCNYIGKNARIGAGAVVTKDVPDNATVVGIPAKVIKITNDFEM
jgi:acetyltransferase-like isoleucine patch superfamily enzyme